MSIRFLSVCSGIESAASSKPFQKSTARLPDGMRVRAPTRDISGQRFGKLVAIDVVGKSRTNSLVWRCKCDCGGEAQRSSATLRKGKGKSSCGCHLRERQKEHLRTKPTWNKGLTYRTKPDGEEFRNRKAWATALFRERGHVCERCGWAEARCDAHHVLPRSLGGKNTLTNGIVLCPNCHRVAHQSPRKKGLS